MRRHLTVSLIALFVCGQAVAEVTVTTTIRPLQFIAEAIVGEQGSIGSIIDEQDSPHNYSISPSDRVNLQQADVLLWIGPEFEVFVADLFEQRAGSGHVITALELPGLTLHRFNQRQVDPHVWLDPLNAIAIAEALTERLSSIDAANASNYRNNLSLFNAEIETLVQELTAVFSRRPLASFAVYHDAYQYFERRFGLSHGLTLLRNPEVQPGMREILAIREAAGESSPQCLFMEIDSDPDLVETMLASQQVTSVIVDLLGYDIDANRDGYTTLIETVADSFSGCLYQPGTGP